MSEIRPGMEFQLGMRHGQAFAFLTRAQRALQFVPDQETRLFTVDEKEHLLDAWDDLAFALLALGYDPDTKSYCEEEWHNRCIDMPSDSG